MSALLTPALWPPSRPEDFVVAEIPLYAPSGRGDHTFVCIEKRGRTTEQVARDLARVAGVRSGDVGYAGRKDRAALARQWFSVPGLEPARALALDLPGVQVLEATRHAHKLRTGHLRGNHFEICLRGVEPARAPAARARLADLCRWGMPNRFGAQRFGRDGRNAEDAARLLRGGRVGDRRHARFLLSALQAQVFNAVLEGRGLPLDCVEVGDVAVVHASGGLFRVEDPEVEAHRAAAFEISATGPIFGTRVEEPGGVVAERERAVLASLGIPPREELRAPRGVRLRGARRALRVRPQQAELQQRDDALHLRFALPAGSYATVLIAELLAARPDAPLHAETGP